MNVTYLFDPLCGWCYGAAPALEHLAALPGVTLTMAPTGLFAGPGARVMDKGFASFAWQNDQRIARMTNQPFTESYRNNVLEAAGSLFDSAPATLGIVAAGLVDAKQEIVALKALQKARYVDGRNSASLAVVADILREAGLAQAADRVLLSDDALLEAYRARLTSARQDMNTFGAQGVPALVVGTGDSRKLLPSSSLFGGFETLASQLAA